MSGWIGALMAATEGNLKLRKPSVCLAALALDEASIGVEDVMSGVTILMSGSLSMRDAIESLVLTVLGSSRRFVGFGADDNDPVVVVRQCKQQAGWRLEASDSGRGAVVIVGELADVHPPQVLATADRKTYLDGEFLPGSLEAAILAVTGEHVELDGHWPRVEFSDAVSCIAKGSTAVECAGRLGKLVNKSFDDRQDDDGLDHIPRYGAEPARPDQAAAGVVKRLSEMSGFGALGDWGMQAAVDIRAYAAGQLAWTEVDRGIVISGPPGSGKTTFAKAFALECGVDLVTTTYTEWSTAGGSIGDSMSKGLTKFFDAWRKKASASPFVLFVDEIDTLGVRGANAHNDSWYGSIINAWLAFLDGAVPRDGIIVVAATNHADRIDPALMRPGRLDRHVVLPYPDTAAMAGIVRHHLGPDAVIDDAELARAARVCRGMSPAEVEQAARDARRLARRTYARRVCPGDLVSVLTARRIERLQRPGMAEVDRRVAIHEAGHAVALLQTDPHTLVHLDVDQGEMCTRVLPLSTRAGIERQLTVLLAAMAAEVMLLGDHGSTVQIDLHQATNLAASAQAAWGMGETLRAHTVANALNDEGIEAAVEAILREAHARATALVTESREAVVRLAAVLQEQRFLDAAEVQAVVENPAPERARNRDYMSRTTGRSGRYPDLKR
jgi:hypothetical protein